jgi:hypothetical protein
VAVNPDLDPEWHPFDEEIEAVLAANPGLLERIEEQHRKLQQGELKLIEHSEVRRILRERGVPLGPEEPAVG